jgi:spore germination protein KA
MKIMIIGVQTHTKVCVCYLEGIVNHKILDEVYKRLKGINIDGILDAGYIKEFIKDSPFSLVKTVGNTERPDIVAAKLLEGRIAIAVDGTPVVLTVPFLFIENFQSNEDYYINFYFSSLNRLLRISAFIIAISVPAVYTALVTFHQEAIPTPLLLSISAARQGVPFPTIVEVFVFLFTFEIMREAGLRMPFYVGQSLNIVGALVLGTASVEARLVSAPIVIVVSVTAIAGLMLTETKITAIILRLVLLLLSAFIGLYGYIFGLMGFLIYLCELRSFGVPYMLPLTTLDPSELKDTAIRAPWWYMKRRPKLITANRVRQANGDK